MNQRFSSHYHDALVRDGRGVRIHTRRLLASLECCGAFSGSLRILESLLTVVQVRKFQPIARSTIRPQPDKETGIFTVKPCQKCAPFTISEASDRWCGSRGTRNRPRCLQVEVDARERAEDGCAVETTVRQKSASRQVIHPREQEILPPLPASDVQILPDPVRRWLG